MKLADVKITMGKTQKERKFGKGVATADSPAEVQIEENFEIKELTEEEILASREAAEEAKRLAEALGKQQVAVRVAFENLVKKNPDWKLLPEDDIVRKEIERLQTRLGQLQSVGGSLGEHKDFATFVAEIRETDTESDIAVGFAMTSLVQKGYYELHKGEKPKRWPAGTIFLYDKVYLSCRNEDGSASSRTRAIEAEARKMTDAHKKSRVAKVKGGNTKLDQFVKASYADTYTFYSPVRVIPAKDGRPAREDKEGWVLVKLENVNKGEKGKKAYWVFDILDAVGSCSWLAKEGKKRMPHFWLPAGRPITKYENRMEEEAFKKTRAKISALRGMVWAWCDEQDDKEKTGLVRDLLEDKKFNKNSKKS